MNTALIPCLVVLVQVTVTSAFAHLDTGIVVDDRASVFTDTADGVWKIDKQLALTRISELEFHWLASDLKGGFAGGPAQFGNFQRITWGRC